MIVNFCQIKDITIGEYYYINGVQYKRISESSSTIVGLFGGMTHDPFERVLKEINYKKGNTMETKELGKITCCKFGFGGYQESMMGLHLTFEGKGWGCGTSILGFWNDTIKWTPNCKWTEESRSQQRVDMVKEIDKTLREAKVDSVDKLKGIPVEVIFENRMIKSWRILAEVL